VPALGLSLRAWLGVAVWLGLPPLAARLLGRVGRRRQMHAVERIWARGILRHLGVRLDVSGLEYVDQREQYVVAPLHESFPDVLALAALPLDLRFVARDELFAWRWLGPYLRDSGQIEVCPERGAWSYRGLVAEARAAFDTGESVVIFPQGTILGIESDFHRGAFALAATLGRPILPVALTGGHRVWEYPYTPRLRFGERMGLRVLPPVVAGRGQAPDEVRVVVRRLLKAAALEPDMAPPRRFIPSRDGYWDGYAYSIDPDFPEPAAEIARHRAATSPESV